MTHLQSYNVNNKTRATLSIHFPLYWTCRNRNGTEHSRRIEASSPLVLHCHVGVSQELWLEFLMHTEWPATTAANKNEKYVSVMSVWNVDKRSKYTYVYTLWQVLWSDFNDGSREAVQEAECLYIAINQQHEPQHYDHHRGRWRVPALFVPTWTTTSAAFWCCCWCCCITIVGGLSFNYNSPLMHCFTVIKPANINKLGLEWH